jgi:N-acetylglutamate synthase-like GNAT family acetyltransferase
MLDDMLIEQAQLTDAPEILALQKLAYLSEAEINQDFTIPPLTQTLEEIEHEFQTKTVLKAIRDGRIIGSVRAYLQEGTCYIGRLIVHPDFQNQGIGAKLLRAIEECFAQARRYELFTGEKSERNMYFYQKWGYHIFRKEDLTDKVPLVFLEKEGVV